MRLPDGFGRPAGWMSPLEPWSNPNYIPGSPHNNPDGGLPSPSQPTTSPVALEKAVVVNSNFPFASINSQTIILALNTSVKFLDQQSNKRNFLGLRNTSTTANIFIDFNSTASAASWLLIGPGQIVLFDAVVPQDDLYAFSNTAATTLAYAYSTFIP